MITAMKLDPLFILGTTRSGTSVLQLALLSQTRYSGVGEGHFLPLFTKLFAAVESHYEKNAMATQITGTLLHRIPKEAIDNRILAMVKNIYERQFDGEPFTDKTPTLEAIEAAPLIQQIWPKAKIIYCQRRGLENIASKIRKFPDQKFESACREWVACCRAWAQVRPQLSSYLELEQYDMLTKPETVVARIHSYLNLTDTESKDMVDYLTNQRPEQTGATENPKTLATMEWTDSQLAFFKKNCTAEMRKQGYSLDEKYWLD